ncbi:MAG: 3,4-dihydroxy-2-butanone-4-phosphate synthase [Rhodospirillaceae bacterium]
MTPQLPANAQSGNLSSTEVIIEEARQGRMVILVDDEDRENEGDLVIPADAASPTAINFMIRFGCGLVCLALAHDRVDKLQLPLMTRHNQTRHQTAFTTSIEAREGVTTGISAADRARTVQVAIDPACGAFDIVSPGHIFPLVARDGGVLVRAGHTEAAVDIARLAGRAPSGVICEILNEDGTMARLPDLVPFARLHGLKIGTIADLISYRRRTETLIMRTFEGEILSRFGGRFRIVTYVNRISGAEHVALVKGDVASTSSASGSDQSSNIAPVLVRMHAHDLLDDVLAESAAGRAANLQAAMAMIAQAERGVVVLLCEASEKSLADRMRARLEGRTQTGTELRDYGVGAQILLDLGVSHMILLSNHRKTIVGLEGYGLTVVGHQTIAVDDALSATGGTATDG